MSKLIVNDLHNVTEYDMRAMSGVSGGVGPAAVFIAGAAVGWGVGKLLDAGADYIANEKYSDEFLRLAGKATPQDVKDAFQI